MEISFFILIQLCYFVLTQQIEEQPSAYLYDFDNNTFYIPSNIRSFIYGYESWITLENIQIVLAGNLIIYLKKDLHIRYEKLDFYERGNLTIIQDPQHNYSLILEQISDPQLCSLPEEKGIINIQSHQRYSYSHIYNVANQNKLYLKDSQFINLQQQFHFHSFEYISFSQIIFQVNEKSEDSFLINEQINIKEESFKSSLIPKPIAIFSLNTQGDIMFIKQIYLIQNQIRFFNKFNKIFSLFNFDNYEQSSCFQAKFESLIGVAFLNPVHLVLIGGQFKNCIFLNDQKNLVNQNISRSILIEADIIQEINFLNLIGYDLQFYANQVSSIIFYGNKNVLLKFPKTIVSSYIIESDIRISCVDEQIKLRNIKFHNSQIQFHNQLRQIFIKNNFFFNALIIFNFDVDNLDFVQSELIESKIKFSQHLKSINFLKCYIYKKLLESDFLSIIKQPSLNKQIIINIIYSNIKGTFHSFLNLEGCIQICTDCNYLQGMDILMIFKDNRINFDYFNNTSQFVLCLKANLFQYRFNELSELKEIKEYNDKYPMLNNLNIPEYQQTSSLVVRSPINYRIIDLTLLNNLNTNFILKINNFEKAFSFTEIYQEQFQILDSIEQNLRFYDLEKHILQPKLIEFQILNDHSLLLEKSRKMLITLPIEKQATINVLITLKYQQSETQAELNYQNQIFSFQPLNLTLSFLQESLWINLSSPIQEMLQIQLTFKYCLVGQYSQIDNNCINECRNIVSDKICSQQCIIGYYQLNEHQCNLCSEGCMKCNSQQQICEICLPQLILFNGQCHFNCPKGFFQKNDNKCSACDNNCEHCLNINNCFDCSDYYINTQLHGCLQCSSNEVAQNDICIICNEKCEHNQCNGVRQMDCLKCKPEFTNYFGECI